MVVALPIRSDVVKMVDLVAFSIGQGQGLSWRIVERVGAGVARARDDGYRRRASFIVQSAAALASSAVINAFIILRSAHELHDAWAEKQ